MRGLLVTLTVAVALFGSSNTAPAARAVTVTSVCDKAGIEEIETQIAREDRPYASIKPEVDAVLRSHLADKQNSCYVVERADRSQVDSPLVYLSGAAVAEAVAGDSWRQAGDRTSACRSYKAAVSYYSRLLNDGNPYGEPLAIFNARRQGATTGRAKVVRALSQYCR